MSCASCSPSISPSRARSRRGFSIRIEIRTWRAPPQLHRAALQLRDETRQLSESFALPGGEGVEERFHRAAQRERRRLSDGGRCRRSIEADARRAKHRFAERAAQEPMPPAAPSLSPANEMTDRERGRENRTTDAQ